jgi:hypothetical protein
MLHRPAVIRSVISGALLAASALWLWQRGLPAAPVARAEALIAVIAGGLWLALAEGGASAPRRFLAVGSLVALSLPLAIHVPALAAALQLASPGLVGWGRALALSVLAVGWRLPGRLRAKFAQRGGLRAFSS